MRGGPRDRHGVVLALAATAALTAGIVLFFCAVGLASEGEPAEGEAPAALPDTNAFTPSNSLPDRVAIYYFHRTIRCSNCLKFESYTDEAIRTSFPEELEEGTLEWRIFNRDDPENKHLVDDYCVTENSVIAVELRDDVPRAWANLDAIWGFVGDKPTFLSYIRGEVWSRLDALSESKADTSDARSNVDPETPTGR